MRSPRERLGLRSDRAALRLAVRDPVPRAQERRWAAVMPVALGGTMIVGDDVARFWSKTRRLPDSSCVEWVGARDRDGYGKFMTGPRGNQRTNRPHRWIWERAIGPLGDRILLHSCDRPACVSLQHLSPGTQKQNIEDCASKGRLVGHRIVSLREAGEILWCYRRGARVTDVARGYGLSRAGVYAIASGRNYSHAIEIDPRGES
jgi:hypothetical protein